MFPQPKVVETLSHTKLQDKREIGSPGILCCHNGSSQKSHLFTLKSFDNSELGQDEPLVLDHYWKHKPPTYQY